MKRNPSTEAEEEQSRAIGRQIERSREEISYGRGRSERRLGSPIGRKSPAGTTRTVIEVFLAGAQPDLPALRGDIRSGLREVPRVAARIENAERKIRELRKEFSMRDADPSDEDMAEMIALTDKLSALYAEQSAEAQAELDALRPPTSDEAKKAKFIKSIRLFVSDALMHVAPAMDELQVDLDRPPLTRKDRKHMSDMAMRLRSVAGGANAELKKFIKSHGRDLREEERKRLTEASDWLALGAQSLASVPTIVDYLNRRETETGADLPAAVREILIAMRNAGDTDEEEYETVLDTTDENAFAVLSRGVKGMKRGWDKMVSASSLIVSEMAASESESRSGEYSPNGGRFPRCTMDI